MTSRKISETQKLVRAIVILIRNTTWKCGKLERSIVSYLSRKTRGFGKPQTRVNDMIHRFQLTGRKKNEFLHALRRLERRRIVRILNVQI